MSKNLDADLSYGAGQSTSAFSQDSPPISEKNTDGKNGFCRKLAQESLGFNKLQKSFIELDFSYRKLK